jgi:hypothetical protein
MLVAPAYPDSTLGAVLGGLDLGPDFTIHSFAVKLLPSAITHQFVTCVALAALLCACGSADDDELLAESAAIMARVPVGTPFMEVPAAMRRLGFTCAAERREVADGQGGVRGTESHFSCTRETSQWLVCTRRTRAVFIHLNGKVANVLVNVGHFCS